MPGYIAEFGGKYCMWCTVGDAPSTHLMTEADLFEYLREQKPQLEREAFDLRMNRVRLQGCSASYGLTKADLLACNRAGPGESHVTTEQEMVALYSKRSAAAPTGDSHE